MRVFGYIPNLYGKYKHFLIHSSHILQITAFPRKKTVKQVYGKTIKQ